MIATKGGLRRAGPGTWARDGRPEHLREACEGSLRRLRLERIDLYQLHALDPKVPFEESVGALAELRDEGKIRHVGLSNVGVEQLERRRRSSRSSRCRTATTSPTARPRTCSRTASAQGIGFIPWFPLAAGDLAEPGGRSAGSRAHDATPGQVALAWLLARSPVMLPIPGTASVAHLEENVAAADLTLSDEDIAQIEAAV